MTLFSCLEIKKSFGDKNVLKDITFDIKNGERVGLVGQNGSGKSTLANIIFGNLPPDGGSVILFRRDTRIGYLMQATSYTVNTFNTMMEMSQYNENIEHFLETSSCLGLVKVQKWDLERFNHVSGGEKTKLALAHIWATKPELLILDEPTNHLDFHGVEWLVNEVNKYRGTALIISHDRYFLDKTVNRIIELDDGLVQHYAGNYSFYRDEKMRRFKSQLHQYNTQEKYKVKIESEIARLENWSSKAHREAGKVGKMAEMRMGVKEFYRSKAKKMDRQIKSRIIRLKRIEVDGVLKPKQESKVVFDFDRLEKRGRRILEAKHIGKRYGDRLLFQNSTFYIQRGDKIGVIGPNGCGKTTLMSMVMGKEKPDQGNLWISSSAQIAYLSQEVEDSNQEKSILDLIQDYDRTLAQTLYANMGFNEMMLKVPIKQLSLGERTRIKIANLILEENDFLLLDEPTNHLDLQSREQLEDSLSTYQGTVLLVSHDRYLLERICNKIVVFENDKIRRFDCSFAEYINKIVEQKKEKNEENVSQEEKMVMEYRVAYLLGKMTRYAPLSQEYERLDLEYKDLIKRLSNGKEGSKNQ